MNRARVRLASRVASVAAFREARASQRLAEARKAHEAACSAVDEATRALLWIEHRRASELDGGRFDGTICAWLDQARLLAAGALTAREGVAERASHDEQGCMEGWVIARARSEGAASRAGDMHAAYVAATESKAAERTIETWLAQSVGRV